MFSGERKQLFFVSQHSFSWSLETTLTRLLVQGLMVFTLDCCQKVGEMLEHTFNFVGVVKTLRSFGETKKAV